MGGWITADNLKLDGWSKREQPSLEVCLERVEHIKNLNKPTIKADCIIEKE